jgi:hypothetical protein
LEEIEGDFEEDVTKIDLRNWRCEDGRWMEQVGFDISGVEPLDFAIRELVRQQNTNQIF